MPAGLADSARGNPELIGFEQSSSYAAAPAPAKSSEPPPSRLVPKPEPLLREQRKEAELFAYIQGEKASPSNSSGSVISFAKRAIVRTLSVVAQMTS